MRRLCLLWILLLAGSNGCVTSLHPVYDEESLVYDPMLVGTWVNDPKTMHIESAGDQTYRVTLEDKGQRTIYLARLVQLGEARFADLSHDDEILEELFKDQFLPLLVRTHLFCLIRLEGGELQVAPMDADWLADELKSGSISLAHEKTEDGLILTAPTALLQTFLKEMEKRSAQAFPEPLVWQRK